MSNCILFRAINLNSLVTTSWVVIPWTQYPTAIAFSAVCLKSWELIYLKMVVYFLRIRNAEPRWESVPSTALKATKYFELTFLKWINFYVSKIYNREQH